MNNLLHYTRQAAVEASAESQIFLSRASTRVLSLSGTKKLLLTIAAIVLYYALFAGASWAASNCTDGDAEKLVDFIGHLTRLVSYAVGALSLLMFMVGALLIVVGGTSSRVNQGFKILKNALIGLAVAVGAFALQKLFVSAVGAGLGPGSSAPECVTDGQNDMS